MKHKIGIILVSNREQVIRDNWLSTLKALDKFRDKIDTGFSFVVQEPVSESLIRELQKLGPVVHKKKMSPFNWVETKNEACRNVDAKYWLNTDDDFKFDGMNTTGDWTTAERYMDAVIYLDDHPKCGYVMMNGFFGGHAFGKEIRLAKTGMWALRCGAFLRNVTKEWTYARPELNRPGALDETAAVYSRIEEGYFPARGFNTPVYNGRTKRIQDNHDRIEYNNAYIYSKGIGAAIREYYDEPNWRYETKKLPQKLSLIHALRNM